MASDYKVGMVAQLLSSGQSQQKGKLTSLFSAPQRAAASCDKAPTGIIGKNKKKKEDGKASDASKENNEKSENPLKLNKQKAQNMIGFNPPPGIVHESLKASDSKSGEKRKKDSVDSGGEDAKDAKRPRRDRQKKASEKRTIFIGNVPLTTSKKALVKLFKQFGEIESVRFRCAPIADPATKKRVAVITKEFHDKRNNISAFICFKEKDAAKKALTLNGHLIDGLHIRVDSAKLGTKHETDRSVFVGNLPFSIEEEQIRSHFEDCGNIENIRVVRDRKTNLGKGFCYILFESGASVTKALKKNKSELNKRELRVQRCQEHSKNDLTKTKKKKKTSKSATKDTDIDSTEVTTTVARGTKKPHKKMNKMWRPTNLNSLKFLQAQKLTLEKKRRQAKKKKKNAQENKKKDTEIDKVLGEVPKTQVRSAADKKFVKKSPRDKKGFKGSGGGNGKGKQYTDKRAGRGKKGRKGGNFRKDKSAGHR